MGTRLVRIPHYMGDFKCIGSACEDTCCAGWRIDIDRESYERYRQLQHPDLERLASCMERNEAPPREEMYARMIMSSDLRCPQLDEHNLCKIHAALGESYLSTVCAAYPRITNVVGDILEMTLSLSCPVATRLVLLNPDGLSFTVQEEPDDRRHLFQRKWPSGRCDEPQRERCFPELRDLTVGILQNRYYSLHERLLILGHFYHQLQDTFTQGNLDTVPVHMETITRSVANGSIRYRTDSLEPSIPEQLRFMRQLTDLRLFGGVKNERYLQCLNEGLGAIDYMGADLKDNTVQLYKSGYERFYLPLMADHPYILENYLVHTCYQQLLPLLHKPDVMDGILLFIANYAWIQFHLIGLAAYYKEAFNTGHVLKLIQSFSKTMEHAGAFPKKMLSLLKQDNTPPVERIAVWILQTAPRSNSQCSQEPLRSGLIEPDISA